MTQSQVLTGPIGSAHRLDLSLIEKPTTLDAWFLDLPQVHPFWPRYLLSVVHLRPEPGFGPPVLHYPGATHELIVVALDLEKGPTAGVPSTWFPLLPVNVTFQFHGLSDARAVSLAAFAAAQVVRGALWVETADVRWSREQWALQLNAEHDRLAQLGDQ